MRTIAILFALLAGLALPARAQEPDAARRELLRRINEERATKRIPLLRLVDPLNNAAQQHAEEISRQGTLRLANGSEESMNERLRKLSYDAHAWTESAISTAGDLASVLREWKDQDKDTHKSLMDDDYRDLGIGISKLRGAPLYVFLFATPEAEFFARATASLRDAGRVRAAVLEQVNAARRKAGAQPLRASAQLDQAAQKHAEDMLARGFFAHESPEGKTVRERAREAGYDWRAIGENIAEGQFTVDEVMDSWMKSPDHRRNILDRGFTELGVGLALGKGKNGERRVLWAQSFGAPNVSAPPKKR
jgi:uncharacterized protein YkwD